MLSRAEYGHVMKRYALIILCIPVATWACYNSKSTSEEYIDFIQKAYLINKSCTSGAQVFEGDSNTEMMFMMRTYFSEPTCNRAVGGSKVEDCISAPSI